jgi:hypothetical protein
LLQLLQLLWLLVLLLQVLMKPFLLLQLGMLQWQPWCLLLAQKDPACSLPLS